MLRGIKKCALFLQTVCNFVNGALVQHQEWDGKESTITRKVEDGKLVVVSARHCAGVTVRTPSRTAGGGREGRTSYIRNAGQGGSPLWGGGAGGEPCGLEATLCCDIPG